MRSGTSTDPPRVALVVPYNSFWEAAVPYDLRAEREAFADRAEAGLRGRAEIVVRATVASVEDGEALSREIAAVNAEAILVLQTLAVQPAYTVAALGPPSGVPVVVWSASRLRRIPAEFDHAAITSEGATVGTPMLTNMLVRSGRPFELVVGLVEEDDTLDALVRALRVGAAVSRLRRSRVGRVGPVFPGYGCVDADDRALRQATGIEPVRIEAAELRELYVTVRPERIAELERETLATYVVQPEAEGDVLARSLRAACALDDLVALHRLDAGALNCHVPELRFGEEVGIAPCFALGRQTSRGIPWTCAGDVVTAVAMLTLKRLGGAAQYHELESLDYETGELVVASSGEFDLDFAGERPLLVRNLWYDRDPHCGACACFSGPPGPATLVGFTELEEPSRRYRFVIADGELTASRWPGVGTAHAGFRFSSGPGVQGWTRWCLAGASHHSAATPGRFVEDVESVARFLGVEAVRA